MFSLGAYICQLWCVPMEHWILKGMHWHHWSSMHMGKYGIASSHTPITCGRWAKLNVWKELLLLQEQQSLADLLVKKLQSNTVHGIPHQSGNLNKYPQIYDNILYFLKSIYFLLKGYLKYFVGCSWMQLFDGNNCKPPEKFSDPT